MITITIMMIIIVIIMNGHVYIPLNKRHEDEQVNKSLLSYIYIYK
jgi:hypothetical protein